MAIRARLGRSAVIVTVALATSVVGCSGEVGSPPPADAKRKAEVETGKAGGAASIEELRKAYETAHRRRDFKALDDLYGADLALPQWLARGVLSPTQVAMREVTKYPIRAVEFEASPPRAQGRSGDVSYRKGRQTGHVVGDTRGKLILVMANGERLDPAYVVLKYYGRFFLEVEQVIVEDAVQHLKTGRPCKWVALPMDDSHRPRDPDSPVDAILGR
jgi:hypothetical protein